MNIRPLPFETVRTEENALSSPGFRARDFSEATVLASIRCEIGWPARSVAIARWDLVDLAAPAAFDRIQITT
jgi:hypothetical protein